MKLTTIVEFVESQASLKQTAEDLVTPDPASEEALATLQGAFAKATESEDEVVDPAPTTDTVHPETRR